MPEAGTSQSNLEHMPALHEVKDPKETQKEPFQQGIHHLNSQESPEQDFQSEVEMGW